MEGSRSARRVAILRVERLRPGGEDPVLETEFGIPWTEIRFAPDSRPALGPDGRVHLEAAGSYALFASVVGVESPPPGESVTAYPAAPGDEWGTVLAAWKRDTEPRVSRAGWLLSACLRRTVDRSRDKFLLAIPPEGPDVVVLHLAR